jgi:dTDP-4-dehydrorhamnose reductase
LEGEQAILDADPRAIIMRTGWLYGAGASTGQPAAMTATEADDLITEILRAGAKDGTGSVQVPDDEVVSPRYLGSLARVVLDMTLPDCKPLYVTMDESDFVPNLRSIPGGIYHYADWGRATPSQSAAVVARHALDHKLIARPVEIIPKLAAAFPSRVARPLYQCLSAQKLKGAMVLFQHS